ncbi:MAG: UDP-N-acetylglucosamine 2-epimerase [Anaerolineales bacterium]|nr:UDP-N-acetylglucosamine 2-epimerase [Anaerolineales bacterium]
MKNIRLLLVAGIRSQFIKMASFLEAIDTYNQNSSCKLTAIRINTGQHYDNLLLSQQLADLNLSFDYQIFHKIRTAEDIFAHSFVELSKYFDKFDPNVDLVVVFGDGNPAVIGALVAARKGYKIVHVEAGEKRASHEHEEINRRIVDALSDIHLCVSHRAVQCLKDEGKSENVYWTGDLAYEFLKNNINKMTFDNIYPDKEFVLATIHRPENLGEYALTNIIRALEGFSNKVHFFCHPRTKLRLLELDLMSTKNIYFSDALPYSKMLSAITNSLFLLTDSGGLIREASHLGKRCVVRRDEGGWPELMQVGYNLRVGIELEELKSSLNKVKSLIDIKSPPPEILYRHNGAKYALEILCKFANKLEIGKN